MKLFFILDFVEVKKPSFFGSCRFTLTILCNLGVFQMMILRFNLSMAIVCMTDSNQNDIILQQTNSSNNASVFDSQNYSTNTLQVCNIKATAINSNTVKENSSKINY